FDDIAEKFARNIYGTTKGRIRQAVLWQDLETLLAGLPQRPLRILDAGGGQGQIACQLAARGHRVILCDISAQMLQRAAQHAEEQGVSARMELVQSQPQAVLAALEKCLAPGGALSLMFYNYNGLLMLNTLVGNMEYVKLGMPKRKRRSLSPDHPLDPVQVYGWLEQLGLTISGKTGVRVFHDYLRDKTQQIGAFDDLLALEQRYCRQEPFVSLGRYIHVMAHKKGDMKDPL
ncbi:MAG: methyltransferase domain-containing protein, partial [Edwardsiella sp. (in: enterobacteria)]